MLLWIPLVFPAPSSGVPRVQVRSCEILIGQITNKTRACDWAVGSQKGRAESFKEGKEIAGEEEMERDGMEDIRMWKKVRWGHMA